MVDTLPLLLAAASGRLAPASMGQGPADGLPTVMPVACLKAKTSWGALGVSQGAPPVGRAT